MGQKLKICWVFMKENNRSTNIKITFPLTIYYDASCPLCATEMQTLKQSDRDNKLILVDCSDSNFITDAYCPVSKDTMMARIYAQDAKGLWISGVDVFAFAYQASGFNWLGKLWASPILRPIFSRLYPIIADNRQWLSRTPLPYLLNRLLRACASN